MAKDKELLLASEVAEILGKGWSRQRVHVQLKRGTFPEPASYVKMRGFNGPLWTREQIDQFQQRGKVK